MNVGNNGGSVNYDQFVIIGIILATSLILLFVFFATMLVLYLLKKHIRKASEKYHGIIVLNKKYKFNDKLLDPYIYYKTFDTKQKYDRYDIFYSLYEIVERTGIDYWKNINGAALYNATLYRQYSQNVDSLLKENKSNSGKFSIFSRLYGKLELRECKKTMLARPVTALFVVCRIGYTSPKGVNSYSDYKIYTYDDILHCHEIIKNIEEKQRTKKYQRDRMTPSLRYDVMKRDGFRCVLCGRSVAKDGVNLEVDHIKPVSKGGLTVASNLRTLCEDCNRGKRDKYDVNGVN